MRVASFQGSNYNNFSHKVTYISIFSQKAATSSQFLSILALGAQELPMGLLYMYILCAQHTPSCGVVALHSRYNVVGFPRPTHVS